MLHNNILEQSGFRELNAGELEAIGGGYYNEDPIPGGGGSGFGGPQMEYFRATGIWIDNAAYADTLVNSAGFQGGGFEGGGEGSGGDIEYQGEIVVTPTIQDVQSGLGTLHVHLGKDGQYFQFEKYDGEWLLIGGGSYDILLPGWGGEVGTGGVNVSIGGKGYVLSPSWSVFD